MTGAMISNSWSWCRLPTITAHADQWERSHDRRQSAAAIAADVHLWSRICDSRLLVVLYKRNV